MDELDEAYASLARARDDCDWDATRRHLALIAKLHAGLRETEPTSVLGAAHLLREAASLLLRSCPPYYGDGLREVAGRLDEGRRDISDLVWLRGIVKTLLTGAHGEAGQNAAGLMALAIKGAARPVLLYRSVAPRPRNTEPVLNETHG